MIGYYHRHLPDLHSTLAPFHELKGKNANAKHIMGSLRFKAAFALTKYQLANVAALARPDYSKDFVVDVDSASSSGSGAILSQYDDPSDLDSLRPLAFWSRRFTSEERRYGVRDQECVGLVDALMAWRQYVVGARTVVRTDHKSLEWLLRTAHRDGTRVSGLALKVQGFDIEIQYVPGRDHGNPDCVSRALPRTLAEGEQLGALDDSRPDIDDRVEDAASLANAVVSVACNRDLDPSLSSLPIAAVFSLLASCSLPATAAALFSGGERGRGLRLFLLRPRRRFSLWRSRHLRLQRLTSVPHSRRLQRRNRVQRVINILFRCCFCDPLGRARTTSWSIDRTAYSASRPLNALHTRTAFRAPCESSYHVTSASRIRIAQRPAANSQPLSATSANANRTLA